MLAVLTGNEERFQSLLTKTEQLAGAHALGVFEAQVRDALHWAGGARRGHRLSIESVRRIVVTQIERHMPRVYDEVRVGLAAGSSRRARA